MEGVASQGRFPAGVEREPRLLEPSLEQGLLQAERVFLCHLFQGSQGAFRVVERMAVVDLAHVDVGVEAVRMAGRPARHSSMVRLT